MFIAIAALAFAAMPGMAFADPTCSVDFKADTVTVLYDNPDVPNCVLFPPEGGYAGGTCENVIHLTSFGSMNVVCDPPVKSEDI